MNIQSATGKRRQTKRVTQRDIAKLAGVSHVAVSHVLCQPHRARISPEKQHEILRIARELGYRPRGITTHAIGLVVEPEGIWWDSTTSIITLADEVLRALGFRMTISTLNLDNLDQASQLFDQKKVDGVIFTAWQTDAATHLKSLDVPWMLIADADADEDSDIDQVGMDTTQTAYRVTNYLLERGHRFFCVVTGKEGIGNHERAKHGVYEAVASAGLPPQNMEVIHHFGEADFEPQLLALLQCEHPPTAIIATSAGGALVAMNRLQQNGYRIPEDISIVSLIDSPRLKQFKPQITATTALGRLQIQMAIDRMMVKIQQPETIPHRVLLAGDMIERDSVRSL